MSSLIGFLSLVIAVGLNSILIFSNFIFNFGGFRFFQIVRLSSIFTLLAFFSLMYAYVSSDFSNFNVYENSHSDKPIIYKISGTWGNHEGSMLLWLAILSSYSLFFSFTKNFSIDLI